jgi:hypothetical protein
VLLCAWLQAAQVVQTLFLLTIVEDGQSAIEHRSVTDDQNPVFWPFVPAQDLVQSPHVLFHRGCVCLLPAECSPSEENAPILGGIAGQLDLAFVHRCVVGEAEIDELAAFVLAHHRLRVLRMMKAVRS